MSDGGAPPPAAGGGGGDGGGGGGRNYARALLYCAVAAGSWWCIKRTPGMPWADGAFHITLTYALVQIYRSAWSDQPPAPPELLTNQIDWYLEHRRAPVLVAQVASAWPSVVHHKIVFVLSHLGSVPSVVDWFEVRNWEDWLDDFILLIDVLALGAITRYALPKYDTRWSWLLACGLVGSRHVLPALAESAGARRDDGAALGLIVTNYLAARALAGQVLLDGCGCPYVTEKCCS